MKQFTAHFRGSAITIIMFACLSARLAAQYDSSYYIVDTGQQQCYSNTAPITAPGTGQAFYGQDAQHQGNQPQYVDNGNGTISDPVTGLMWVKARGSKVSWEKALADAATCSVGGYGDWRMPTIKELYSLIDFNGKSGLTAATSVPYLNTTYFDFAFGNTAIGERIIDCQDWSSTTYVHFTMNGDSTAFGVNFADGRIKGYPKKRLPAGDRNQLYVRFVRGNAHYGVNNFIDNQDSTITDRATGLMWVKPDSRGGMNWQTALAWVQAKNTSGYLGYSDWRLPNAKELQSIIDYTRSPSTTNSAAIDPVFLASSIGGGEYPFYWTSTTHKEGPPTSPGGEMAAYLCFGRGLGWMEQPPSSSNYVLLDVHGAGAQRSDPKTGDPANYPHGNGPQGDVIRIYNYVRLVRGGNRYIPVELSSLRATALPEVRSVRLEWTTESEVNNMGFFVQRRTMEGAWEELAESFTEGRGTTDVAQRYSYVDQPSACGPWLYRLRQVDHDGTQTFSHDVMVTLDQTDDADPAGFALASYPNPFGVSVGAGSTKISYRLLRDAAVRLRIYDSEGRLVTTLAEGMQSAGSHTALFDAADLPGGSYFCRLDAEGAAGVHRLTLLR
ncbi:MAG: DUF1566 domain-containing protein [Bacteroidetes bacterium]|nr:DUF1566 domain-containing protein [Bacteroidota bacterium]